MSSTIYLEQFSVFKLYKLCKLCLLTSKLHCWVITEWTIRTWFFCASYRIKALVICSTDVALKINYFIKYKSAWQGIVLGFFIWKKWRFSDKKNVEIKDTCRCYFINKTWRSCNQNKYTKRFRILCTTGVN